MPESSEYSALAHKSASFVDGPLLSPGYCSWIDRFCRICHLAFLNPSHIEASEDIERVFTVTLPAFLAALDIPYFL